MKNLFLITILFFLSCSKESSSGEGAINYEAKPSTTEEVEVKKQVKETLVVEKLTEEEKLKILLGAPANDRARSFQEVISFLDPYGETFAYLNFQDTKDKYTQKGIKLWEFISENTETKPSTVKQVNQFKDFVHALGIMDFDAVGLSHYRLDDGLIRNKFAVHRKESSSPGLYWHCFGKNEKFESIDFLPEETVFAAGFRVNIDALIELNQLLIKNDELTKNSPLNKPDEKLQLLQDLNKISTGEISFAVFWDHKGEELSMKTLSEVSGAVFIKLKENADFSKASSFDFKKIMSFLGSKKDYKSLQIVNKGNYLVLTNNEGKELLSREKLLLNKQSFKEKLEHVSIEGSMFNYLSPDISERLYDYLLNEIPPGAGQEMLDIFLSREDLDYQFLNVMQNRPEGFYYSGVSTFGSYSFLLVNLTFSFFHHFMFIDDFSSAKQLDSLVKDTNLDDYSSFLTDSISKISKLAPSKKRAADEKPKPSLAETKKDFEFIRYALDQYRKKNNGYYPSPDGALGLKRLVKAKLLKKSEYLISSFDTERSKPASIDFTEKETSYLYLGGDLTKDSAGYYFPLVVSKPGLLDKGFIVLLANNKILHFKSGGDSFSSILSTLNKSYKYNERQKDVLRNKIKKFSD